MIIYSKPEVAVSQSLIILCCVHQGIHLSLVSRISLLTGCDAMFAYVKFVLPVVPGGRIRLPFNYYITQIKLLVNLFGFKYRYAVDIPRK